MLVDRVIIWSGAALALLVMLAALPVDFAIPLGPAYHDTYYIVAHWHILGVLAAVIASFSVLVWTLRRRKLDKDRDQ